MPTVVASFVAQGFAVEVFDQAKPVLQQTAVRHMLVERALLTMYDALHGATRGKNLPQRPWNMRKQLFYL